MRYRNAEAMLDNADFVSRGVELLNLLASAAIADTVQGQVDPTAILQEWQPTPDVNSPHYLVQTFLAEHNNRRVAVKANRPGDEPIDYYLSYPDYGQANLGFIWGFVSPRFARKEWGEPLGFRVKGIRVLPILTSVVHAVHDDGRPRVKIAISD